jgi:hypothetical protein
MRGDEQLQELGAIAEMSMGQGCVIAFAFRPHFRTQMLASYTPLINAILRAGICDDHAGAS